MMEEDGPPGSESHQTGITPKKRKKKIGSRNVSIIVRNFLAYFCPILFLVLIDL